MHNLTAGKILIDGQNIAKVTQESLRQAVSLVPQDPILFHRTLMENIKYGKPEATDKEIIEAAKAAHAHEFISELTNGYETYVGERGIKLSGGERQRVAIARALANKPAIILADEPTGSLDSKNGQMILERLRELHEKENVTLILVTHDMDVASMADRTIEVLDGKICN